MSAPKADALDAVVTALREADPSDLSADLAFEAALLLFSEREWPSLQRFALAALAREQQPRFLAAAGDLAFLSAYRQGVGDIVKDDPARFAATFQPTLDRLQGNPALAARHPVFAALARCITNVDIEDFASLASAADHAIGAAGPLTGALGASESVLPPADLPDLARRGWEILDTETHHDEEVPLDAGRAVVLSLDETYFKRFAADYVAVFTERNEGETLHLHCVGFSPDLSSLRRIAARRGNRIAASRESGSLARLSSDERRGLAAGARYLRLPRLLKRYRQIVISDVDGYLTAPVAKLPAPSGRIHLATRLLDPGRRLQRLPWEAVAANAFAIDRSEATLAFSRYVADYLAAAWGLARTQRRRFFFSDQNALYAGYRAFAGRCTFRRIPFGFSQAADWRTFRSGTAKSAALAKEAKRARKPTS